MKKAFIHIGLQKTASTFLQEKIFPEASGLNYVGRPYTQENDAFNTLQYADEALFDREAFRAELEMLAGQSNDKPLMISDELFSGLAFWGFVNRGIIAKRLSDAIPEAEIILFLRGQVSLIESLYNQYVKVGWVAQPLNNAFLQRHGKGLAFEEWKNGKQEWVGRNRRFNHRCLFSPSHFMFSKQISLYETLFSKVHVFLYEDFKNDPNAQLDRLESVVSTKLPRVPRERKEIVNRKLDGDDLHRKIIQNKLSSVSYVFLGPRGKLLASLLSPLFKRQSQEERKSYIYNVLSEAGVFADNRMLENRRGIGFPRFRTEYFPDG